VSGAITPIDVNGGNFTVGMPTPPPENPSVSVVSPTENVTQSQTFTVNISVDPAGIGVTMGEVKYLTFDPSVVECDDIVAGDFLGTAPAVIKKEIDNDAGTVWYTLWDTSNTEHNTSGTFATVTFTVKEDAPDGTYDLGLTGVGLANVSGPITPVDANNGTFTVGVPIEQADLIVTDITPKCGYMFANETNNINATIKNNGTADVGAFNVGFDIAGTVKKVSVSGLAAGANTTVVVDTTGRNAGDSVAITVTADCDGAISESNETNNVMSKTFTVYNNGYKNKSFMGMDSLELFEHEEEMYGGVVYNVSGTKYYGFAPTNTSTRIHHIEIPAGMTVKKARLYVYWYDYWSNPSPGCMANLSVNFSGTTFTTPDAVYTDQKGFGDWNTPKGTYAYNVTSLVNGSGDYIVIVENIDPNNKTTLLGEMLFVVYEDPTETTKIQLWILEGNDLLMAADDTHGSYNYGVSPEEATATVTFPGTIDVANVSSATLISVVAQGNEPGTNMLFNGEVVKSDAWDSPTEAYPNSKINVESVDVTANLNASGNNMGFQDTGTSGMQASNAILVVTWGLPKTGDFNDDGTVNMQDAIYLVKYLYNIPGYEEIHADGDINSDGTVNMQDAIYLVKYLYNIPGYEELYPGDL